MNPVLVQTCIAAPLVAALGVDALLRREKAPVHWTLLALLVTIGAWMAGQTLRFSSDGGPARAMGFHVVWLAAHALPPVALCVAALQARLTLFERGRRWIVYSGAPFGLLYLGFLSNPLHGLFYAAGFESFAGPPTGWKGPLFVAFEVWTYGFLVGSVVVCARAAWRGSTPHTRRGAQLLSAAFALPVAVQAGFMLELIPLSFPLTPATVGVSAVLIAAAIRRYELFDVPPLVRHDVLEHLRDGLVLADANGRVIDVNAAAESILREEREALLGRELDRVLHTLVPDAEDDESPVFLASLAFDAGPASAEVEAPGGRTVVVTAEAVSAVGSHPAARFLLLRDRTDERRTELALRQRQKLESVGVLAAGVAHEVNNPLAFVRSNLAHLQGVAERLAPASRALDVKARAELEEMGEVLDESLGGLDRIARIVEGLLRLSRRSSDAVGPTDVNAAVREALRFAELHENRAVRVETRLGAVPLVRASHDHLVQVFLNLFLNAKQALASRSDGTIEVTTRADDDAVEIAVADDGPGVPADQRELVFTPFFTTRQPREGTGLGLSIALDLVQQYDGTLALDAGPAGGALFRVRLPACEAAVAAAPAPAERASA